MLPNDADLTTKLADNLTLNIPIITAAMDTVTESQMACLLLAGGLGESMHYVYAQQQMKFVGKTF